MKDIKEFQAIKNLKRTFFVLLDKCILKMFKKLIFCSFLALNLKILIFYKFIKIFNNTWVIKNYSLLK